MGRQDDEDFVTYTVVISPAKAGIPSDTLQVKIRKFKGGSPRSFLNWICDFQTLARKKGWNDEQKSLNLIALIEGDLVHEVERLVAQARTEKWSFDKFYTAVGYSLYQKVVAKIWTMRYGI